MSNTLPNRSTGNGVLMSAICFFAFTALLAYTNAARGSGHWDRLDDPMIWGWMALAAAMFGFWGYVALILSATQKTALGRRLLIGLGLAHLVLAALASRGTFSHDNTASIVFQALWVPLVSSVVMGPLLLLFGWIGKAYGKPDHD
jgi:hypothetical protein